MWSLCGKREGSSDPLLRQAKRLEEYQAEFGHALRSPSADLLYEEFQVRKQAGEAVDLAEFYARFPDRAAELRRLLESAYSLLGAK